MWYLSVFPNVISGGYSELCHITGAVQICFSFFEPGICPASDPTGSSAGLAALGDSVGLCC